jgi:hypothetical protein
LTVNIIRNRGYVVLAGLNCMNRESKNGNYEQNQTKTYHIHRSCSPAPVGIGGVIKTCQ